MIQVLIRIGQRRLPQGAVWLSDSAVTWFYLQLPSDFFRLATPESLPAT